MSEITVFQLAASNALHIGSAAIGDKMCRTELTVRTAQLCAAIAVNNNNNNIIIINITSICTRSAFFFNESRRTKVPKLYSKESMSSGTF